MILYILFFTRNRKSIYGWYFQLFRRSFWFSNQHRSYLFVCIVRTRRIYTDEASTNKRKMSDLNAWEREVMLLRCASSFSLAEVSCSFVFTCARSFDSVPIKWYKEIMTMLIIMHCRFIIINNNNNNNNMNIYNNNDYNYNIYNVTINKLQWMTIKIRWQLYNLMLQKIIYCDSITRYISLFNSFSLVHSIPLTHCQPWRK